MSLARLSAALVELGADSYTDVGRFRFDHTAESFLGTSVRNLICEAGRFDLTFTPTDMGTYDDMLPDAVEMLVPVEGEPDPVRVRCADLDAIYRSKLTLGRAKDEPALRFLEQVLGIASPTPTAATAGDPPHLSEQPSDPELEQLRQRIAEIQKQAQERGRSPGVDGLSL